MAPLDVICRGGAPGCGGVVGDGGTGTAGATGMSGAGAPGCGGANAGAGSKARKKESAAPGRQGHRDEQRGRAGVLGHGCTEVRWRGRRGRVGGKEEERWRY